MGRAGFAIISITGYHANTGPTQQGCPMSSRYSCEVVIRVTFAERSRPTITTSQTSYHFRFFRIKGCLSSGTAFQASCAQWQGSAKKTNNEQFGFAYPLTSGRIRSTITIGVPTLISFIAYTGAFSSNCFTRLFINLSEKPARKRCLMKSRDIYGGLTRAFEGKPGLVYI
jgi:hypothetical protein